MKTTRKTRLASRLGRSVATTLTVASMLLIAHGCDDAQATDAAQNVTVAADEGTIGMRQVSSVLAEQHNMPHLHVEPAILNLGPVQKGQAARGTVTITNRFEQPVTIKARTSCGCTVADVPSQPLEPGESTDVTISMRVNGSVGQEQKKTVRFAAEDGSNQVTVDVSAVTQEFIEVHPAILPRHFSVDQEIELRSTDERPFAIVNVEPPVAASYENQKSTSHHMRVEKSLWEEHGKPAHLTITTDHPHVEDLLIKSIRSSRPPARDDAEHQLRSHKDHLDLGRIGLGESARGSLIWRGDIPAALKNARVKCNDSDCVVSIARSNFFTDSVFTAFEVQNSTGAGSVDCECTLEVDGRRGTFSYSAYLEQHTQ